MAGRLFAIVGPSGAGKDTLMEGAARARPDIHRARRTISRPLSAETEAFESVTPEEFERLREAGAFALHWRAHGLGYGIRREEFAPLAAGRTVIFNGSRKALPEALARFPALRAIHIAAPAEVLARRLAARGRESAADIAARLERGAAEARPAAGGVVVSNDGSPEDGVARLLAALQPVSA